MPWLSLTELADVTLGGAGLELLKRPAQRLLARFTTPARAGKVCVMRGCSAELCRPAGDSSCDARLAPWNRMVEENTGIAAGGGSMFTTCVSAMLKA